MKSVVKQIVAFMLIVVLLLQIGVGSNVQVKGAVRLGDTHNLLKCEAEKNQDGVSLQCVSAVLIEGSTGKIIYEKDKDKKLMPASITKIMTLLLIFEAIKKGKIHLEDKVTVSEHAASMGGSQVYLEPNESQTVDTMIKCISVASANDASVSMAEFVAGSEEAFVQQMNEKAKELGMENTHFLNCCGLDDDITTGHYSTAYDIALMSKELITKYPEISKYSTVWMDTFTHVTKKGEKEFGLTNTNKLVRTYQGITGLKTGSTSKAKYCLSATAKRNGMDLIAVVMAAPEPKARFQEAARLLDYGFANCSIYQDENKEFINKEIPIEKGKKQNILVKPSKAFSYVQFSKESQEKITKKVQWTEPLNAPIQAGDEVGKIVYYKGKENIGTVSLLSLEKVEKATYIDYFQKIWREFLIA